MGYFNQNLIEIIILIKINANGFGFCRQNLNYHLMGIKFHRQISNQAVHLDWGCLITQAY